MSEHPPVPCPNCDGVLSYEPGAAFTCGKCDDSWSFPHGWSHKNYADLWREWTRGKAVVPLPEPVVSGTRHAAWRTDEGTVEAASLSGTAVVFVSGVERSPGEVRKRAAILLAAADVAERLASEAEGTTP